MAIGTVQFRSKALGRQTTYTVILPDASVVGPGPYRVLYQLHGASDTHSAWLFETGIARYVARLPLIVVMPEGALSRWCNVGPNEMWEDLMVQDFPAHISTTYHARTDREGTAIGGLSMGGLGSMRLALRYPDRYASVASHSSALFTLAEWPPDRLRVPKVPENDVYEVAAKLDPAQAPAILFDCGTDDRLIGGNRNFHAHLTQLGIPHHYAEFPGAHTWDYWDTHVQEAIAHHCATLAMSPVSSTAG